MYFFSFYENFKDFKVNIQRSNKKLYAKILSRWRVNTKLILVPEKIQQGNCLEKRGFLDILDRMQVSGLLVYKVHLLSRMWKFFQLIFLKQFSYKKLDLLRYKLWKAPERQFLPPQFFDVVLWKKNFPDAPLVTSSFKKQPKIIKKITPILAQRKEGWGVGVWKRNMPKNELTISSP